jgi:hypothetical protein
MVIGYAPGSTQEMEKNMRIYLAILILVGAAGTAMAEESVHPGDIPRGNTKVAEVALSNKALQLRYISNGSMLGVRDSRFSGTFFLSEDRDFVLSTGMVFPVGYDFGRLSVLVGPQLYAAYLNNKNDVMALSFGADLRFVLNRKYDFAVSGQAYYAPDILTFGSANSVSDLSARAEVALAKQFQLFGGMRWFRFDLTQGGRRDVQKELFFGLGYRF